MTNRGVDPERRRAYGYPCPDGGKRAYVGVVEYELSRQAPSQSGFVSGSAPEIFSGIYGMSYSASRRHTVGYVPPAALGKQTGGTYIMPLYTIERPVHAAQVSAASSEVNIPDKRGDQPILTLLAIRVFRRRAKSATYPSVHAPAFLKSSARSGSRWSSPQICLRSSMPQSPVLTYEMTSFCRQFRFLSAEPTGCLPAL